MTRARRKTNRPKVQVTRKYEEEFASQLEAAWATELTAMKERGTIQEWWYEPFTLILTKKGKRKTTYTPDFLVINHAGAVEIHEVKGFWRGDARVKFKMAVDLNPWAEFKVITRKTKNSPWEEEDWS